MTKVVDGDQTDETYKCIPADQLELGVRTGYYLLKALDIVRRLPPP